MRKLFKTLKLQLFNKILLIDVLLHKIEVSAANIISFLELAWFFRLVSEDYLVVSVSEDPFLEGLGWADIHYFLHDLFEKLLNCFRVMEAELIEIDSFFIGYDIIESIYDFFGSVGVVDIVEDDVDGLRGDLFEIELRPDMCFQLSEWFLSIS